MIERKTILSDCRKWRYTLWRQFEDDLFYGTENSRPMAGQYVQFIGLNPSTADEAKDDNTIRRCIRFAKHWGFDALCMTNLFAWRDTKPENMKKAAEPVGTDNTHHILQVALGAGLVIAAWGCDGNYRNRQTEFLAEIKAAGLALCHLGLNDDGTPKHPLYIAANTKPQQWKI